MTIIVIGNGFDQAIMLFFGSLRTLVIELIMKTDCKREAY